MSRSTPPSSPAPERRAFGIPYDWRRPTWTRVRSRLWNPADRRLFTPKPFGQGHVVNGYWLAHPVRYWRGRRAS